MIHLHRLRLTGARRQYDVDFDRRESNLAIISGPIHTGKTTVLQLVGYLLGQDEHPTHPELARTVRTAELELSINGERWTIERPLFSSEHVAYIRAGGLLDRGNPVQRKLIDPPGDPDALSRWLLDAIGLGGARVRVTDGNPNSTTNDLSIRDVLWLAFLPSKRLDNQALLHENQGQKHYKLRQVIELLFDVHDDRLGQLLDQQKRVREQRRAAEQEVLVLETFLAEEDVSPREDVEARHAALAHEREETRRRFDALNQQAATATSTANELRVRFSRARSQTAQAAARVRDREALLERLLPLRGQYAEDEGKLVFADEAKRLFDPLSVAHCPACLEKLAAPPELRDGECSLCHSTISASGDEPTFGFERERKALRRRIKDLDAYTTEVVYEIREGRIALAAFEEAQEQLGRDLDDRTAEDLSPFVAERELLVRDLARLGAEDTEIRRVLRWYDALERRRAQVLQLAEQLGAIKDALETLAGNQPERATVVEELTERFSATLTAWGFPKVDDPESPKVDDHFVPFVRGRVYRDIGSDGALTLVALAWTLSIFELAVEQGAPHPGFLMLDSPQKNLAPRADRTADEYMDPAIVANMYAHITKWTSAHPDAQVIIVDHEPPAAVDDRIVVRFTRRIGDGRYGLIDDQTGTRQGRSRGRAPGPTLHRR